MTMIRPDERLAELEESRLMILDILKSIQRSAMNFLAEAGQGDTPGMDTRETRILGDARYWLKAARETEAEIEALKRKDARIAHEYGLDLELARAEIDQRLARLAEAARSARSDACDPVLPAAHDTVGAGGLADATGRGASERAE